MANPKHTIDVGIAAIGAILPVNRDGQASPLSSATGCTTGIGYWLGAAAQRRHG